MVAIALTGCLSGGLHRRGDQQIVVHANYGKAIVGTSSLGFIGGGTADNAGLTLSYDQFVEDRVAVSSSVSYRYFDQSDGPVHAAELEVGLRFFFFEFETVAFSFDIYIGGMVGTRSVPLNGSHGNFLLGIGPTMEIQLSKKLSVLLGYQFRHLSNAGGFRDPDNPTQNDHRFYAGVAIPW